MPETIKIILSDSLLEKLIGSAVKKTEREAAIARLRIEAKQALEDWYQKGYCEGSDIAKELSFEQIQEVIGWHEMKCADSDQPIRLCDCVPSNAFLLSAMDVGRVPGYVLEAYVFGALDGIVKFWEDIEGELD
ncbi:hypothetical protein K9N68_33760 [Kovacikia minuta CCNUW1]|uniref:hypothetical protein n=1 Tax=Kovacikia minuta TaxID=2931930 RepID=UPI001CC989A8|nr:hypothetical protein [Kovacikia minuta]UBF26410.1 hypothetical protein K9N68_33760 [Kovacikia minuta CCNUW1]